MCVVVVRIGVYVFLLFKSAQRRCCKKLKIYIIKYRAKKRQREREMEPLNNKNIYLCCDIFCQSKLQYVK